jgi:uncharacterized protein YndB with AHSA1/START domain
MEPKMAIADAPETPGIDRELTIAARPETVFAYLVEPDKMVRWMGRTAELDPRPGGLYRIDYNGSDIVRGEFLEVDPPRRVVFSWGWEEPGSTTPPGSSTVEVTLTPVDGGTRLNLRHTGLGADEIDGHAVGWDQFLPTLVTVAAEAELA